MEASTEMGPLVSDEQYQKVAGYIESGKTEGGEVIAGGNYDNSSGGHFVHPTVFAKTNADMTLVKEEIFGPVVCAQPFSDESLEKIANEANNTNFGLAAVSGLKILASLIKWLQKFVQEPFGSTVITFLMHLFHLVDIKNLDGEEKWVMKF